MVTVLYAQLTMSISKNAIKMKILVVLDTVMTLCQTLIQDYNEDWGVTPFLLL